MRTQQQSSMLRAAVRAVALSITGLVSGGVLATMPAMAWASEAVAKEVEFYIGPQSLESALLQLSKQADVQVMMGAMSLVGQQTPGIKGRLSVSEALSKLLDKTGLTFEARGNTVTVRAVTAAETSGTVFPLPTTTMVFTVAQAGPGDGGTENRSGEPSASTGETLAEVVVTGTHIAGSKSASPVLVFTQKDFLKAGAATAQQFLATLPQNFGGGPSDDTSNDPGAQNNPSYGTAINLRGTGAGSTLTLVNGHRWAAGGTAEFVDISMIPLSAVERIEVLGEGASAIYGSDAVGGVVNFIMRKDYEGADTRLRYGITTEGDGVEYQATQSLGTTWSGGNALVSYEFYERESIDASERKFSSQAIGPFELVPKQKRHSIYASATQGITDSAQITTDLFYSTRDAHYVDYDPSLSEVNTFAADTQQFGGSVGLTYKLSSDWTLAMSGGANRNELDLEAVSPTVLLNATETLYQLSFVDATLSGPLLRVPAGEIKLAVGLSGRRESYEYEDRFSRFDGAFNARAAYAEFLIPLVDDNDSVADDARLMLTAAGRYERYNTFGDTVNPKFALIWNAADNLTVRGTYGTSLRIPSQYQLNEFNGTYLLTTIPDSQSPTGFTRSVVLTGNNADLYEEEAKTWTFGIVLQPLGLPGFQAELTYFDVDYTDRIQRSGLPSRLVINNPSYVELTTRRSGTSDPSFDATVADLLSGRIRNIGCAGSVNPATRACSEPAANFGAIIDNRLVNMAGMRTNGVDLTARQAMVSDIGVFDFELNSSYLFHFDQRVSGTAPLASLLNTAQNPIDLRFRASATWSANPWSITTAVNYADNYIDRLGPTELDVDSWTTVDFTVTYDLTQPSSESWLEGTALSLTLLNVFDEAPPFFAHHAVGLGYDPANADPIGRNIFISLAKKW